MFQVFNRYPFICCLRLNGIGGITEKSNQQSTAATCYLLTELKKICGFDAAK